MKRKIQGIFVGHHDRTRAIPYIAKSGSVRGKSRTSQTLSDAWEPTNLEDGSVDPWPMLIRSHMVITEIILTKKFITDEEGAGLLLPKIVAEKPPEVERRRFHVLSANIEAHGHMGSCLGQALLSKVAKPRKDEFRERAGTIFEKTLTGEARIDTCKRRFVWDSVEMVAPELKLTKKVTADKDGAGPPLPRIVVERAPEVEPKRFYVLSANIEVHGHTGGCPGCAALASHGKATKPHNDGCRERIRTNIERTLTGKARMNAYKDRIAETEGVKERKRARVERGAGDVPGVSEKQR